MSIQYAQINLIPDELLIEHGLLGFKDASSIDFKKQYFRNVVYCNEVLKFQNQGLTEFIALKGISLLMNKVYENFGQRSISDIDLLVKDIESFSNQLTSNGYFEVDNHKWRANNFKKVFSKIEFGIEMVVELHTRLFYHNDSIEFETITLDNNIKILSLEMNLIHLVGHLAFQHTFLKLNWLLDISLFIEKFKNEIDWTKFNQLLIDFKLINSWNLCLYSMQLVFPNKIDNYNFKVGFIAKLVLTKEFLMFPHKKKMQFYIIKHLCKDSIWESLKYDLVWFLSMGWKK